MCTGTRLRLDGVRAVCMGYYLVDSRCSLPNLGARIVSGAAAAPACIHLIGALVKHALASYIRGDMSVTVVVTVIADYWCT